MTPTGRSLAWVKARGRRIKLGVLRVKQINLKVTPTTLTRFAWVLIAIQVAICGGGLVWSHAVMDHAFSSLLLWARCYT